MENLNEKRRRLVLQVIVLIITAVITSYLFYLFKILVPLIFLNISYPYPIYLSNWVLGASVSFLIFKENETLNMALLAQIFPMLAFVVTVLIRELILDVYHLFCVIIGVYILLKKYRINLKKLICFEVLFFTWTIILFAMGEYSNVLFSNDLFRIIFTLGFHVAIYCVNFLVMYLRYRNLINNLPLNNN